jgi:hypothetical protein
MEVEKSNRIVPRNLCGRRIGVEDRDNAFKGPAAAIQMWLVNVESKTATFAKERGAVIQHMPRINELVHPQPGYDMLRAENTVQ